MGKDTQPVTDTAEVVAVEETTEAPRTARDFIEAAHEAKQQAAQHERRTYWQLVLNTIASPGDFTQGEELASIAGRLGFTPDDYDRHTADINRWCELVVESKRVPELDEQIADEKIAVFKSRRDAEVEAATIQADLKLANEIALIRGTGHPKPVEYHARQDQAWALHRERMNAHEIAKTKLSAERARIRANLTEAATIAERFKSLGFDINTAMRGETEVTHA